MMKIHLILALILVLFLLPGCGGSGVEIEELETEESEADTYQLPDTGQETCYDNTTDIICGSEFDGQDADYTFNPLSYTSDTDTVTDNNTGLIWQRQGDDTTRDYNNAKTYCANLVLGSQTDWRLPDKKELASIVNYGKYPAIDDAFPTSKISPAYWSSTANAEDTSQAWYVYFSNGNVLPSFTTSKKYARCVRSGQFPTATFVDQGDQTVLDEKTGLVWQQEDDNTQRTWEAAIKYCEDELILGGKSDWRLPNIRELESITENNEYDPAINETFFPNTDFFGYWSSTTYPDPNLSDSAEYAHFGHGSVMAYLKTDDFWVRCVRSGQ